MQPALQLALLLAILLPACKLAASLFSRLGIPPILGELLVGVVLGPGAINLLHLHLFDGGHGAALGHFLGLSWPTAFFLGGALTATSVSISARTLMDAGKMSSPEATVILGAAVIDDVMGLFVLAFLAAGSTTKGASFGLAPMASAWLQQQLPFAGSHPLLVLSFLWLGIWGRNAGWIP